MKSLGLMLKDIRISKGISQEQLAQGLCTQSLISKIEKGDVSPSIEIFENLIKKLGIDANFLMGYFRNPRYEYEEWLKGEIELLLTTYDFEVLYKNINLHKNNVLFKNEIMQQFFNYCEAIISYYKKNDFKRSLNHLLNSLEKSVTVEPFVSEFEVRIKMGMGIIYNEEGKKWNDGRCYERAKECYREAYKAFKELIVVTDKSIIIKLYYNYARLLYDTGNYLIAIFLFNEALNIAAELKSLVAVPELYLYLGLSFIKLRQVSKALHYFDLSSIHYNFINKRMKEGIF